MNAAEDLPRLHDPPGGAVADLLERAAARAVDPREAEDVERQPQRLPLPLGLNPRLPPLRRGGEGRVLVDPAAGMVAIDAGGGEIAHPARPGPCQLCAMGGEEWIALAPRRRRGEDMAGARQRGPEIARPEERLDTAGLELRGLGGAPRGADHRPALRQKAVGQSLRGIAVPEGKKRLHAVTIPAPQRRCKGRACRAPSSVRGGLIPAREPAHPLGRQRQETDP